MSDVGYYLDGYNFSIRLHNGQWVMFCRKTTDKPCETPEQVQAYFGWVASNKRKNESIKC